jgi:amino acid adenylation domain-containing protein
VTAAAPTGATDLTERQLLIWLEQELARDVPANNMVAVFRIVPAETLDLERFRHAFASVVQRSDAIRTVFAPAGAEVRQRVRSDLEGEVEAVDLSQASDPQKAFRAWFDERRQRRFNLEECAFDTALVWLGGSEFAWYLCLHHLITDATSLALIYRRTLEAYRGEPPQDLPPFAEFVDYALAQASSPQHQASAAFWHERLATRLEPVRFYGRANPRSTVYSRRRTLTLESPQLEALRLASLGRSGALGGDLALAAAFVAVAIAYVSRVSGNRLIGIGMPVLNRPSKRFRDTIGLCMEVPSVRAEIEDDETFASLLDKVRRELLQVLLHSRCCTSNPAHGLAYEVMLNFQTAKFPALLGPTHTELFTGTTAFGATDTPQAEHASAIGSAPLVITVHDYDGRGTPSITVDYNRAVFDEGAADRAAGHLHQLLDACFADPQRRLDAIDLLSADEREQLVVRFNDTAVARRCGDTTVALFEAQVARRPHQTAVCCSAQTLDYAGLCARVNRLASRLQRMGVQPEDRVAVLLDRSIEMLVVLLAIWKAEAAYVPLDPSHPGGRIAQILVDADPALLLTTSLLRPVLRASATVRVVCVDEEHDPVAEPRDTDVTRRRPGEHAVADRLAYVLFTSGSTGRPKGVEVAHSMLCNLLLSMARQPGVGAEDRVLALTPITFDIAAIELYLPLVVGGTVHIVDQPTSTDGRRLRAHLEQSPVTVIQATPATWRSLIDCGWRGGPRVRLLSGGEALDTDLARQLLLRGSALWNLYGPTETTVYSTLHRVIAAADALAIPIGRPIDNTRVYVLGRCGLPVPIGVTGEIFIGGAGVARGYSGREDLTRERFVPDPFAGQDGARMYQTGDLGAFTDDGVLHYHGRADRQIKLRGFRIEPAEVESALRAHADVRDCVVVVRAVNDEPRLVAYAVWTTASAATSRNPAELRRFLGDRLPAYMIPATFVALAALPLTPNGKIDVTALPPPAPGALPDAPFEPPSGDLESRIAALWTEVLGIAHVGRRDDFFALGGDSLLAVRLLHAIRATLGVDVSLASLFAKPTVEALAAALVQGEAAGIGLIPLQPRGTKTPLFLLCGIHLYQQLAAHLGDEQPIYGIFLPIEEQLFEAERQGDAPAAAEQPIDLTVETLAAGYLEVIRARQPHGPYCLGGLSMGGLLAFEVAQRLRDAGEQVTLLILLDTWLPRSRKRSFVAWSVAHLRRFCCGDLSALHRVIEPQARRSRAWLSRLGLLPKRSTPMSPRAHVAAKMDQLRMRYALRAATHYDPHIRPYPGRVILFRALDREEAAGWRIEDCCGWEQVVTGRLDVVDVRGQHTGILQPPFVETVAKHLRTAMAEVARLETLGAARPWPRR